MMLMCNVDICVHLGSFRIHVLQCHFFKSLEESRRRIVPRNAPWSLVNISVPIFLRCSSLSRENWMFQIDSYDPVARKVINILCNY